MQLECIIFKRVNILLLGILPNFQFIGEIFLKAAMNFDIFFEKKKPKLQVKSHVYA